MTNKTKMTPSRVPTFSVNGSGPSKKKPPTGNGVLKNKIFLFIFLPLMIIISGVTIFFVIQAINNDSAAVISNNDNYVYVLPMSERELETGGTAGKNPFSATGLSPVTLDGLMYNPDGASYAILTSSSKTYVKTVGEAIGDTGWTLTAINDSGVTVSKDELNENLTLQSGAESGIAITPAS
jgi:hypothetical protein